MAYWHISSLLSLAASPSPAVIHLMHIKARSCHESVICKAYFFNYGKHGKLMRRKIAIRVTTSEFNSELKESRMEGTAISAWLDQWKKYFVNGFWQVRKYCTIYYTTLFTTVLSLCVTDPKRFPILYLKPSPVPKKKVQNAFFSRSTLV